MTIKSKSLDKGKSYINYESYIMNDCKNETRQTKNFVKQACFKNPLREQGKFRKRQIKIVCLPVILWLIGVSFFSA